jgi:CheY-like chemotaxis protein
MGLKNRPKALTMPNEPKSPMLLLVEDSEDDAFFFTRALKKSGATCTVHHSFNGAEAIDFLDALSQTDDSPLPLVIFLDLKMPVVNGFEVLGWLKTQTFRTKIHVIVLSGSDQDHDKHLATQLGAADYLVKPVKPDDLLRHLRNICPAQSEAGARL